jgi:hypothetical protein
VGRAAARRGEARHASRDRFRQDHFYTRMVGAEMARKILERLHFPRKQLKKSSNRALPHAVQDAPVRKSTLRLLTYLPLELAPHRLVPGLTGA